MTETVAQINQFAFARALAELSDRLEPGHLTGLLSLDETVVKAVAMAFGDRGILSPLLMAAKELPEAANRDKSLALIFSATCAGKSANQMIAVIGLMSPGADRDACIQDMIKLQALTHPETAIEVAALLSREFTREEMLDWIG